MPAVAPPPAAPAAQLAGTPPGTWQPEGRAVAGRRLDFESASTYMDYDEFENN